MLEEGRQVLRWTCQIISCEWSALRTVMPLLLPADVAEFNLENSEHYGCVYFNLCVL